MKSKYDLSIEEINGLKKYQKKKIYSAQWIIYFLFDGNEIVYIGQSKKGICRIFHHIKENIKIFDSFSYIKIDENENLNLIETSLIIKYKPKYNIRCG